MKNRTTVPYGMLPDLERYLRESGWKIEPTKAYFEVLRATKQGYARPLLVHRRSVYAGGGGYSIDERDIKIYNGWKRNRKKRGLDMFCTKEENDAWNIKYKAGDM